LGVAERAKRFLRRFDERSAAIPDYDSTGPGPEEFRYLLLRRGAVMLRNVADPELLDRIRQKIDELFAKYADVTAERIEQYLASDDPSERDFWLTFRIGQVYERTFREFAGVSFFEIIRNNGLYDLAARAFPESQIEESQICNCRRMTAEETAKLFDRPLGFHVDAQYHFVDRLSINFWTPLMACGKTAPGIKVVLLGARDTRDYLEFSLAGYEKKPTDIAHEHHFRTEKEQLESLRKHNLIECIWTPEFNKGDILVFSSLTMHATHCANGMTEPRTSVEVRLNMPSIPLTF
jgi:hypothetical protein